MSAFLVPLLILVAALAAFWWISRPGSVSPSVSPTPVTEAQVFEGRLSLPEGSVLASGARFLVASVKGKTLTCVDAAGLRRIDDVEMRLRPCRFQMLETGIKVEGGGLQVWVYRKGTRFDAETPAATFGVLGTRFDLEVLPDQTARLRVLEGEVQVKARQSDASQRVAAGSGLQVTLVGAITPLPADAPVPVPVPAPDQNRGEPAKPGTTAPETTPPATASPAPRDEASPQQETPPGGESSPATGEENAGEGGTGMDELLGGR